MPKPNILYLHSHDTGRYVEPYGHAVPTPNLQRLAEEGEVTEEVFSEVTYHAAYEPMRAVRTKRLEYVRRFGGRKKPVLPNCDDGPSKQVWLDAGWADVALPEEELHDLVFDPNETANLATPGSLTEGAWRYAAGEARAAESLAEMRARLDRWMKATDDPLLKGPVPAPTGAKVNNPYQLSPEEPTTMVE